MKYLVIGAGGTGGAISSYLSHGGKDVSLIARGENLNAIRERGFKVTVNSGGEAVTSFIDVKAYSAEEYLALGETPDVIFLCTKSYSVKEVAPFIESVIDENTIIIPILNGVRMGDFVRRFITKGRPIDGCIYISARKDGAGAIWLGDGMFRIVFGQEGGFSSVTREEADQIAADLKDSGIKVVVSDNILRDTLRKFSCIASLAGTGLYYDGKSEIMQAPGEPRDLMCDLVRDVLALAGAMGVEYDIDLVQKNCDIVDHMSPDSSASLQRDIWDGHESEFDSLLVEPIRLGASYGLEMNAFRKVVNATAPRIGYTVEL